MFGLAVSAIMGAVNVVLTLFWNAVRVFVLSAIEKVKQVLMVAAVKGVNVFLQEGMDGLKSLTYSYIEKAGGYVEQVVSKRISAEEMPDNIRSKVSSSYGEEVDVTDDFAHALKLS